MPIIEHIRDSPITMWCPVVELRQYALHPGRREDLIQLFDSKFIECQEAVGLTIMGQFRDLDDPNAFVWLRGLASMGTRAAALSSFYDGPVWRAYRDRANATLIDSDNVLLLRPAHPSSGFVEIARPNETVLVRDRRTGLLVATIYYLAQPADVAFLDFFEGQLAPALHDAGASIDGYYTTEPSPNNFPRLPVRENEPVFVWFSSFPNERAYRLFIVSFTQRLPTTVRQRLAGFLRTEPETHLLVPTTRSRLPAAATGSAR
jgi:hypothetical protein